MRRRASESARHVLPLHDLVVDLAQAAADHAAEEVEELQRRVRVHGEDLVERGAVDGEDGGVALVRLGVGAARLVVDEGHLPEEVAAVEHGQRFLADARDELRDAHPPVEDDEELVALLPLAEIIDPSRKRSSLENVASSFISPAERPRSRKRSTLSSDLTVTSCISR